MPLPSSSSLLTHRYMVKSGPEGINGAHGVFFWKGGFFFGVFLCFGWPAFEAYFVISLVCMVTWKGVGGS